MSLPSSMADFVPCDRLLLLLLLLLLLQKASCLLQERNVSPRDISTGDFKMRRFPICISQYSQFAIDMVSTVRIDWNT